MPSRPVEHVFVLMLENRSFDHMLGFSGIEGRDAATGQPTRIDGLTGSETNPYAGRTYGVAQPADYVMPLDPPHEFPDVVEQLCGPGARYTPGAAYPPITNGGFAASWAQSGGQDPGQVLRGFGPAQLPVLNALAREFAVCDHWHSSMPGPTWPNRFFVHAASSSGLDHSPTTAEVVLWETLAGFRFPAGTIFDRLNGQKVGWRLYGGDPFPMVAALAGIQLALIHPFGEFAGDVARPGYPAAYTFIEPRYNVLSDYRCGTSQHPLDDVTRGEALIRAVYRAIRISPLWDRSLLVITWDEHGGFYDHAAPPAAVAPDGQSASEHNQNGFTFERYGVRVPAVVVSPRIPRNLVDHRVYDHTSILATLEDLFGMPPLTARDAAANKLTPLASLDSPRSDAPLDLPAPASSGGAGCPPVDFAGGVVRQEASHPLARPDDPVNDGNVAGVLHSALRSELALSAPAERARILARFSAIRTRAEALQYAQAVAGKVRAVRGGPPPSA